MNRFVCIASLVVVTACGDASVTPQPPSTTANAATFAAVPLYATPTPCPTETTPSVCDWARAHDVIAQARVLSAEVSWTPTARSDGGVQEIVDPATCIALEPAMRLRVRIIDVIAGDVVAARDEVDVFIGADHIQTWAQQPSTAWPATALRWRDGDERFAVGTDIVLAGFDVGGGALSIWTAIPGVDADDLLDFPPVCSPQPFGGDGITLDAFATAVAACGEQTATSQALRQRWDINAPRAGSLTPWKAARCYRTGD